ncbi:hypothetical protein HMPREF3291_05370 [Bacillus sp. HMSC76G11]|nr:hypothetical protein HMPREF3291_05370 [Bacillus sp. HMSC76G11]
MGSKVLGYIVWGAFFFTAIFIVKGFFGESTETTTEMDLLDELNSRIYELEELNEELVIENEELRYELEGIDYRLDEVETILSIP